MKYTFAITILAAILLSSCKKDPPVAVAGSTEIDITFNSPEATTIAAVGNELNVEGIIDANAMMGGWKMYIQSDNGDTLCFYEDHYEQTQYLFHYHWFPQPGDTGNVILTIDALDVNFGSLDSRSVHFICQ